MIPIVVPPACTQEMECPICRQTMQAGVDHCPGCGHPMPKIRNRRLRKAPLLALLVLGLAVFAGLLENYSSSGSPPDTPATWFVVVVLGILALIVALKSRPH